MKLIYFIKNKDIKARCLSCHVSLMMLNLLNVSDLVEHSQHMTKLLHLNENVKRLLRVHQHVIQKNIRRCEKMNLNGMQNASTCCRLE